MNVKTFASMVKSANEDRPVIKLVGDAQTQYEVIATYDSENPYHVAAYGDWCIDKVVAAYQNAFEVLIKIESIRTVIKEP